MPALFMWMTISNAFDWIICVVCHVFSGFDGHHECVSCSYAQTQCFLQFLVNGSLSEFFSNVGYINDMIDKTRLIACDET